MTEPAKKRPEFRNINAFKDLAELPVATGVPGVGHAPHQRRHHVPADAVHHLDVRHLSVSSEISFAKFKFAFNVGMLGLPGFIWKLLALALIWAYLQHFIAGIRHLYMDVNHAVSKEFGRSSALATLVLSLGLTVVLGAKLFGLY
jgi:succinate dehydrogenase / fumarate reductase cytochrome b subunit